MVSPREALARLREGNLRFASDERGLEVLVGHDRRTELAAGQDPFAIILGCSDSRVPAEIIFDQGLGDDGLVVVGAEYSLETGAVEFFDGAHDA